MGIQEGDLLAGKYLVERVLGVGGTAMVVAARHTDLDQTVAIKFLLPQMLTNADAVARFAREARAAVKITSEHVARIFDVGTFEGGNPYIVMEFLDGVDLGTLVERRGVLSAAEAANFLLQASMAIAEAHTLGIIHRDIKPSNLFCVRSADGELHIKVLDFGISKVTGFNAPGLGLATKASAVLGSPLYMSPEQTRSAREVDARADIWALGVVLYELLTGRTPFVGETLGEIIINIATQAPEPIRRLRPDVPEGLERVFLKCTEKERDRRFRDVSEFARALAPHAPSSSKYAVEKISRIVQSAGQSATVVPAPPLPAPSAVPASTQIGVGNTARPLAPDRRRALVAFVASGVIAASAAASGHLCGPMTGSASGVPSSAIVFDEQPIPIPGDALPTAMVAHPALILPEAAVESFDESFLNVDSTPASTCLVDGRNLGKTPRFHVSVRPGSHAVSCVDIEHGMSKTTSVTLGAGETKSILVKLDWIALRR